MGKTLFLMHYFHEVFRKCNAIYREIKFSKNFHKQRILGLDARYGTVSS